MISKEDLSKNLKELLKTVTPGNLQEITQKVSEHLKFSVDNYDNLTPDAKQITDEMLEKVKNFAGEALVNLPESKEKRRLRRLHAKSLGKHQEVEQYIKALESPPATETDSDRRFKKIFQVRLQNIIDFIFDIYQNTLSGIANFGQLSLLSLCVDELLVTYHLVQHHYINQAYSHIRTVFEHLDKVELFRAKPKWAELWAGSDAKKIRKELSPAEVRKKLGRKKYDPIYNLFSSLGPHSTFKAVQVKSAKKIEPSPKGNPQITMWVGGCPLEHNIVWLNAFAIYALYSVLLQIMKSFEKRLNADEGMEIIKEIFEELIKYIKDDFLVWAKKNKLDVGDFENFLNSRSWDDIEFGRK